MTTTVQQPGTTPKPPKAPAKPKTPKAATPKKPVAAPVPTPAPEAAQTIKDLAVAAAGNIGPNDIAAGLVVMQHDGTIRVTPFNLGVAGVMQLLAQAISMLAGKMRVQGVPAEPNAPAPAPTPVDWIPCGAEHDTVTLHGTAEVRYGADGKFATKVLTGTFICGNEEFGDPVPGVGKACWYRPATEHSA